MDRPIKKAYAGKCLHPTALGAADCYDGNLSGYIQQRVTFLSFRTLFAKTVPSSQAAGPPLAGRLWFLIQRTRSRNTHLNCRFLQPRTQYLP